MNQSTVVKQEDALFYALDDVLDQAVWRRGRVYLHYESATGRSEYTCTSVRALSQALTSIARDMAKTQFSVVDAALLEIVDNIVQECEADIGEYKIPDRRSYR